MPVQQRGAARGGGGGQGLAHQLVAECEGAVLAGQQLPGGGLFGVVQEFHGGAAQHGGQQFQVQPGADHRRGAQQRPGRAEVVAPHRHRFHQRRGQLGARHLLGQFGEEQRMALGALVQLLDPGRADQFGGRLAV